MAQESSNSPLTGVAGAGFVGGEVGAAEGAGAAGVAASSAATGAAASPSSNAAAAADRMGALIMAFLLVRLLEPAPDGASAWFWSNISTPYVTGVTHCPIASL